MVATAPPAVAGDLDAATVELDPPLGRAALGVAGLVGGAPAPGGREVVGFLEGRRRRPPREVEAQRRVVGGEREPYLRERLDDAEAVRADPGVELRSPRALEAHRVLAAADHQAGVPADHVVVRVDAQALEEEDLLLGREDAEVVPVVEGVVGDRHDAEGVRRLVHRQLVVGRQHVVPQRSWSAIADGRTNLPQNHVAVTRLSGRVRLASCVARRRPIGTQDPAVPGRNVPPDALPLPATARRGCPSPYRKT